jgi:hypothetical protein
VADATAFVSLYLAGTEAPREWAVVSSGRARRRKSR